MDIRTQISPQPWLIKASFVLVVFAIPATVFAQNKFFGTTTRGVEGGKGNAQIKMLMDENALRRNETTQNAGDIEGLETRMGTAEGAITTLEGTVSGHTTTLGDHATRIGTLETATADVEEHAKAAMPGMCHETNAKLRWNTTANVWECLPEGDPTVQPFAKTTLPTCTASQLLRSNGSGFTCVNAGSNYVITESDPKVGATTSDQWCRGTGSQVTCDQVAPTGNDPRIGTLTMGKWCTSNGSEINCSSDAPSGGGGGADAGINVIDTYAAGGLTITPVPGLEKWPDYISCPYAGMMYTLFLVRYSGSPQVIYQGTNSNLNTYFNVNGSYAGAAGLAANCGTADGQITSICAEGRCGYFSGGGNSSGGSAVSKYGSGNRCAGDDYIAVCGYAPGSAWNYNTCYGRGHSAAYGWILVWNATAKGYEYSLGGAVDVICSSGGGGASSMQHQDFITPVHAGTELCATTVGGADLQQTTANRFCIEEGYTFGAVTNTSVITKTMAWYQNGTWTSGGCGARIESVRCVK